MVSAAPLESHREGRTGPERDVPSAAPPLLPPPPTTTKTNHNHNHHNIKQQQQQHHPHPRFSSFRSPPVIPPTQHSVYQTTPSSSSSSYPNSTTYHAVTPSPYPCANNTATAATATTYRFETPAYVYGGAAAHLELRAAAGCTCKKSRCVLSLPCFFNTTHVLLFVWGGSVDTVLLRTSMMLTIPSSLSLRWFHNTADVTHDTRARCRCLKLYCQCFSSSTTCGPKCKCSDCHNSTQRAGSIDEARRHILLRNPAAFDAKVRPTYPPGFAPAHYPGWMQAATAAHAKSPSASSSQGHPSLPLLSPSSSSQPSAHDGSVQPKFASRHEAVEAPPPDVSRSGAGCKCRRTYCLKKYCDCYQNANHCSANCKCVDCKNTAPGGGGRRPDGPVNAPHGTTGARLEEARRGDYRPDGPPADRRVRLVPLGTSLRLPPPPPLPDPRYESEQEFIAASRRPQTETPDRLTIMAAVAMTELLNGFPRQPNAGTERNDDDAYVRDGAASTTPTAELTASLAATELNRSASPILVATIDTDGKRKAVGAPVGRSLPIKKRKSPSSPGSTENDDEVQHVVSSSASFNSEESRNPSPVAKFLPSPIGYSPPPGGCPWPTFSPTAPSAPDRFYERSHTNGVMRRSCPIYRALPLHRPSRGGANGERRAPSSPGLPPGRSGYEEMTRPSGLPKALSFRKICSRCGKTRGEHGELGYGNKCVFTDCGKCGAGSRWHEAAGQPMGIQCQLSPRGGAVPGAAAAYERKIRDLAARAELKRLLHQRKAATNTTTTTNALETKGRPDHRLLTSKVAAAAGVAVQRV